MATAPVQLDEESLIREIVAQLDLPEGVKLKRVDQSADSEGEPALRIYFSVSRRIPLRAKRIAVLSSLKDSLQEEIFSAGVTKWPFVHFVEAK